MPFSISRICARIFLIASGLIIPATSWSQDGNWRITNGTIGSFAGWATASGVVPLVGDFNGNGRQDVALLRRHAGWATMPVAFANGNGNWTIRNGGLGSFAGWATSSGVIPLVGDFNGDGRDDVALIRRHGGWATMPVAYSNGGGGWIVRNDGTGSFAGWATASGVRPLVGDFNGDGRDDVALIRQNGGWNTMPIAFSRGSGGWLIRNRSTGSFAGWATASGVRPLVGDFNGDNRDDVALLRQNGGWGTIPIALSQGSGNWQIANRSVGNFAGWATASGVVPLVGDYDGNGRDDIALIRRVGGWSTMPVALSAGGGNWTIRNGGTGSFAGWATASGVVPLVGDFNADGRDDISLLRRVGGWRTMPVALASGNGSWSIANNTTGNYAGWATASGVQPLVGDFTGDGRSDVALLRRNSGWGTMPIAAGVNTPTITTRRLTVARHTNATGNNAAADTIFAAASSVLQTDDGAGDVACPAAFARRGNMSVFTNTDGTLNSAGELATVFNLAPDVKIVPAVNFCENRFNTSFIGCGQFGTFNLIVERFPASQEGILWAHEIGHNVGLPHRVNSTNNLMFDSIGNNRRRVNAAECIAFQFSGSGFVSDGAAGAAEIAATPSGELNENPEMEMTPDLIAALQSDPMMRIELDEAMSAELDLEDALDQSAETEMMAAVATDAEMAMSSEVAAALASDPMMLVPVDEEMAGGDASTQSAELLGQTGGDGPLPPVDEFVRQLYFEGLPLARAAEFGADDLAPLVAILNSPEDVLYHENAALTIGMIGEEASVGHLISYIEASEASPLGADATEAERSYAEKGRAAAMVALGYAANLAASSDAVSYLMDRANQGLSLTAAVDDPATARLTEYAIIALGFSGADEAGLKLIEIGEGLQSVLSTSVASKNAGEAVETGLDIAREISAKGLLGYYAQTE